MCDGAFFPSLVNDMSAVVSYFNERAKKLIELHQAAGLKKYFLWIKGKMQGEGTHVSSLIEEGKEVVVYALINAIMIQKLLKKYDKVSVNCWFINYITVYLFVINHLFLIQYCNRSFNFVGYIL